MSTTPQADSESSYKIGSTVVKARPDEPAYPLTKDKYDLLQHGDVAEDRQTRDVCLGIFAGSLIGVVTSQMNLTWRMFVLGIICISSLSLAVFFTVKIRSRKSDSGCARIRAEIDSHFK